MNTLGSLFSLSANDSMHFAWYSDGKVSAGSSNNLSNERDPYNFKLADGYSLDDVVFISSNDSMHFAWYSDGKVSAGSSNDLSNKRAPYNFKLANGYSLIDWNITVLSTIYKDISYPPENTYSDLLYEQHYSNDSDADVSQTFSYSVERSCTFEWSLTETLLTGLETEFEASIPYIGSATTTAKIELTLESSQTWSETETKTYEISSTVDVPAHTSALTVVWSVDQNNNISIPFTLEMEVSGAYPDRPLSSDEIISQLKAEGFNGTIIDSSASNKVTVSISGNFTGAYGMETHLSASTDQS